MCDKKDGHGIVMHRDELSDLEKGGVHVLFFLCQHQA